MQSVDGDVRLSVSFDMKSVQTNLVQLKKAIKDTLGGFDNVDSKVTPQVADLEKELANATKKINELTKEVEELSKTKLDKTFEGTDKQVNKTSDGIKELKAQTEGITDSAKDVNAEYDETAKEMERIAELAKKAVSQKNEGAKYGTEYFGNRPEYQSYKATTVPVKPKAQPTTTAEKSAISTPDTKEVEKTATAVKEVATNIDYASQEMNKFNSEIPEGTSKLQELHTAVKKAEDNVIELSQKLNEVGNAKVPTAEYTAISQQIATAEKELDKLYTRQAELKQLGKDNGSTWETLNTKIQNVERVLGDAKGEMSVLVQQGKAFTEGSKTPKYAELVKQLKTAQGQLLKSKSRVEEFTKSENKSAKTGYNIGKSLSKGLKTGEKTLIKLGSKVKSVFSAISSNTKNMSKTTSNAFSNINGGVKKGIKSLLKYGLSIKSLYILVRKLKGYIQDGLTNLAGYSNSVNNDISKILSALEKLKNALGTLVQPIIRAVQPAVTSLLNQFTAVTTKVAEFFAALTGQNYVYKAANTQKKFVESLDDTTDSADKAKKSLDEYLSPLDDLNKFQDDKSTSTTSSKSKKDTADPSKMFTTEPVSDKFKKLAKDLKKMFKSADWTDLGKYLGNALNNALRKIDWGKIQNTLKSVAKRIATLLNGFISGTDWKLVGNTIGNAIQSAIQFAYTFITNFDWVSFGSAIANAINGAIGPINPTMLAQGLSKLVIGIFDTLKSLLDTVDWEALGKSIVKFISSIKWKGLGQAAISLIRSFSNALKKTNFKSIGNALRNGISSINWKGVWNSLSEAVSNIVQSIADLFGLKGVSTSKLTKSLKGLYKPIEKIWNTLKKLAENIIEPLVNDLLPAIFDAVGHILDAITPIIDAVTPVINLFITDVARVVESLAPVIDSIGKWVVTMAENGSKVIGPLLNLCTKIIEGLAPAVQFIFDIMSGILGLLTPIFEFVGNIIDTIAGETSEPTISAKLQSELDNLSTVSGDLSTISDNIDTAISEVDTSLRGSADDITYINDLKDRMDELLSKSTLSDSDMTELKTIADLLSEKLPGFKSTWDSLVEVDNNGNLTLKQNQEKTKQAIDNTIDSLKQQYATEALGDQYKELYKEKIQANQDVAAAQDKVSKASETAKKYEDEYNEALKEYNEAQRNYVEGDKEAFEAREKAGDQYYRAKENMLKYNTALSAAQTDLAKTKGKQEELNTKMESMEGVMDVVSGKIKKADGNLQAIRDTIDMGFMTEEEVEKQFKTSADTIYDNTKSLGEQSTAGYKKGVQNTVDDLKEAGKWISNTPMNMVQKLLGIHSPSTEYKQLAKYCVKGFALGFEDESADIAVRDWSDKILTVVKSSVKSVNAYISELPNNFKNNFNRIWSNTKPILNTMLNGFENFFNYLNDGLNGVINNLNSVSTSVGKSTKSTYYTYSTLSGISIPRLATGAIIPPNKEFMAVLGDQKQGTNIETPEKLLRQIVREELGNTQNVVPNKYEIPLQVGRRTLATLVIDEAKLMLAQTGKNPFELT